MEKKLIKTNVGIKCLKVLLGIFTVIFWLTGAALLGGGIYSKIKLGSYDLLTTMNIGKAPYILIGVGAVILVVGMFGCCSIGKENTCMLRTYAVTLGVLFLAEIALAILVVVYRGKIVTSFNDGMMNAMKRYQKDEQYKEAVDNVQKTLKCCGVHNLTDYWTAANWTEYSLPESCCHNPTVCEPHAKDGIVRPPTKAIAVRVAYGIGCPSKVHEGMKNHFGIMMGVVLGVAFLQLIGIIVACCLSNTINTNKYEAV